MPDDTQRTPPPGRARVVKKVVKKTVRRPANSGAAARPAASKPKATAVSRVTRTGGTTPSTTTAPRPAQPKVDLGAKVGTAGRALGARGTGAARSGAGLVRRASGAVSTSTTDRYRATRDWRIPTQPPMRAAVLTGIVAGLVVVLLGWLAGLMFFAVRGTTAGGAWGGVVLVAVALVAFALGSWLLHSFGVVQPRLTSFLAVVLVVIAVLAAFLETAAGVWAWLLLPALGAGAFVAAHRLVVIAEEHAGSPA